MIVVFMMHRELRKSFSGELATAIAADPRLQFQCLLTVGLLALGLLAACLGKRPAGGVGFHHYSGLMPAARST